MKLSWVSLISVTTNARSYYQGKMATETSTSAVRKKSGAWALRFELGVNLPCYTVDSQPLQKLIEQEDWD